MDALSDEDHREFAEAILTFGQMVMDTREFARSISRGDLDVPLPPSDNELAAPLKALHSTLKHLTWQTKQVASGDYDQNIRFMGAFSTAFNTMVAQLAERRQEMDAVAERDQARIEEMEDVVNKDALTGVFNRYYGMKTLHQWTGERVPFKLLFIDMDMLKYVNDAFGHAEGDIYIKNVAKFMGELSDKAVVCRIGGDEFMLLLRECDVDGRDMTEVMETLRSRLADSSPQNDNGKPKYLQSISYGIVDAGEDNTLEMSDLLATADERMYEYKKAHKKGSRT